MTQKQRVTAEQLALIAGVSPLTVSRALNASPPITVKS